MDYKEKLEEAKRLYETANADQRYVLESLFPELAESEDERVRKALLEMVHDTTGDELWVDYNVHKEDALAWLEKQGKQKPAWSEEDEKMIRGLIVICDEWTTRHSFYPIENCEIEKLKNWLESLKERYTWKPSDEQMADLWNMLCECRPADHQLLQDIYYGLKKLKGE